MFKFFFIEKQIALRLTRFLEIKAGEHKLLVSNTRCVINLENGQAQARLYEAHRHICNLTLRSIAESFGQELEESKVNSISDFLKKTATNEKVDELQLNVVVCRAGGKVGAYIFRNGSFIRKITTGEILDLFNFSK